MLMFRFTALIRKSRWSDTLSTMKQMDGLGLHHFRMVVVFIASQLTGCHCQQHRSRRHDGSTSAIHHQSDYRAGKPAAGGC